jgi:hypothetical protein
VSYELHLKPPSGADIRFPQSKIVLRGSYKRAARIIIGKGSRSTVSAGRTNDSCLDRLLLELCMGPVGPPGSRRGTSRPVLRSQRALPVGSNRQPSCGSIGAIFRSGIEGNRSAWGGFVNGVDDGFEYWQAPRR